MPYEAIGGTPAAILVLRAMKAERRGELLGDPVWDEALMARISRELLDALVRYILQANLDADGFRSRVRAFEDAEVKQSVMTLEQKIREEGREEGRQEGLRKGRQEGLIEEKRNAVIRILEERFGEVPGDLHAQIGGVIDDARLSRLFKEAIVSPSLDDFWQVC